MFACPAERRIDVPAPSEDRGKDERRPVLLGRSWAVQSEPMK